MGNSDIIPVIAGLAVGIAFVAMFAMFENNSIFGNSPAHNIGRYPYMTLTIDGLKQTYSMGEDINFTLTAKGYGKYCAEAPSIEIFDSEGNLVWHYVTVNLMGCGDPDISPQEVNDKWNVKERVSLLPSDSDIQVPTINKPGEYGLRASYYGEIIDREFSVDSTFAVYTQYKEPHATDMAGAIPVDINPSPQYYQSVLFSLTFCIA